MSDLTFVHLSDTHILATPDARLHGVDTAAQFRRVAAWIQALPSPPDFVLISGDLANDGEPAAYAHLNDLLAECLQPLAVPVLLALGNHDRRLPFRHVILGQKEATDEAEPYYYSTLIGGVRVVVLDSKVPGQVFGRLDARQLVWLADELNKPTPDGALIVLHHPPFPRAIPRPTAQEAFAGFVNPDDLLAVVRGQPVLGILAGHWHLAAVGGWAGLAVAAAPATAYLADPSVSDGWRFYPGTGFNLCTVSSRQLSVSPLVISNGLDGAWSTSWAEMSARFDAARAEVA